jgi:hypothetical protein
MASGPRSRWPVALLVGLCLSMIAGGAVAVAAPSDTGRPSWHADDAERVTGTVLGVDGPRLTLDGLVGYDPVRGGLGTLTIEVTDATVAEPDATAWSSLHPGDTVDLEIRRQDGGWMAESLTLLDPD